MEAGRLTGGIGQSLAGAAGKSADIGRVYGAMAPADLGFLSGVGQADRGYRQSVIDMARKEMQSPTEQALLPYNYAYGALSGTPSASLIQPSSIYYCACNQSIIGRHRRLYNTTRH